MRILVLGATGRVGSHIVSLALQDEHSITALVRDPNKLKINDENLHIVQGNVLEKQDIENVMANVEIVVSALNTDGTNTLTESMSLILDAMEKEQVKRIITVGTAGILQSRLTQSILRYQSSESKRKSTFAAEEHHKVYHLLKKSDTDWTIVCPTYLPDGQYTGTYRMERDFLPDGGVEISVADTAEFVYQQIQSKEYVKSRVGIAY